MSSRNIMRRVSSLFLASALSLSMLQGTGSMRVAAQEVGIAPVQKEGVEINAVSFFWGTDKDNLTQIQKGDTVRLDTGEEAIYIRGSISTPGDGGAYVLVAELSDAYGRSRKTAYFRDGYAIIPTEEWKTWNGKMTLERLYVEDEGGICYEADLSSEKFAFDFQVQNDCFVGIEAPEIRDLYISAEGTADLSDLAEGDILGFRLESEGGIFRAGEACTLTFYGRNDSDGEFEENISLVYHAESRCFVGSTTITEEMARGVYILDSYTLSGYPRERYSDAEIIDRNESPRTYFCVWKEAAADELLTEVQAFYSTPEGQFSCVASVPAFSTVQEVLDELKKDENYPAEEPEGLADVNAAFRLTDAVLFRRPVAEVNFLFETYLVDFVYTFVGEDGHLQTEIAENLRIDAGAPVSETALVYGPQVPEMAYAFTEWISEEKQVFRSGIYVVGAGYDSSVPIEFTYRYVSEIFPGQEYLTEDRQEVMWFTDTTTCGEVLDAMEYPVRVAGELTSWNVSETLAEHANDSARISRVPQHYVVDAIYAKIPVQADLCWTDGSGYHDREVMLWAKPGSVAGDIKGIIDFPEGPVTWSLSGVEENWPVEPYDIYTLEGSYDEVPVILEYSYYNAEGKWTTTYQTVTVETGALLETVAAQQDAFTPPEAEAYGFLEWELTSEVEDEIAEYGARISYSARYAKHVVSIVADVYGGAGAFRDTMETVIFVEETDTIGDVIARLHEPEAPEGVTFEGWLTEATLDETMPAFLLDKDLYLVAKYSIPLVELNIRYLDDSGIEAEITYGIIAREHITLGEILNRIPALNSAESKYAFLGWNVSEEMLDQEATDLPISSYEVDAMYNVLPEDEPESVSVEVIRFYMNGEYKTCQIEEVLEVPQGTPAEELMNQVELPKEALAGGKEAECFFSEDGTQLVCAEQYEDYKLMLFSIAYVDEATQEKARAEVPLYLQKDYEIPSDGFADVLLAHAGLFHSDAYPVKAVETTTLQMAEDVYSYFYEYSYSKAKVVLHYLNGQEETVILDDEQMRYAPEYQFVPDAGRLWVTAEKEAVRDISVAAGGIYHLYETEQEPWTLLLMDKELHTEHIWDEGTMVYTSAGAFREYHCSDCEEVSRVPAAEVTTLGHAEDGNWYDYVEGQVSSYTGLRYYNGSWWYVEKGKLNFGATTLCKYNGTWWYVEKGKVNFGATTLCKYNGSWWYVEKGKVNFGATTLCKYNGTWWYVEKGKVNFGATTLCKYSGTWWYVEKGLVNFGATTLCKYNGTWWYVEKGRVNFGATTLCKYNGSWWYVEKGRVNFSSAKTLCKYNGSWWYVHNGQVDFAATTLCKYNGTWWYVAGGRVDFGYTGTVSYAGAKWYVKKGIMQYKA